MFIRIINADFAPVPWLTPECRDLVARLLNPDPKARMTVTDALRHPWVRDRMLLRVLSSCTRVDCPHVPSVIALCKCDSEPASGVECV